MRVASFFSGIGGLDLGLEWAGFRAVFQCEINSFCQQVLTKHWPQVPKHDDIKTLSIDAIPAADLWCGGFPCQPFSVAGKRQGQDDSRHLWPVWFNFICSARPKLLLLENVPGLLSANDGRVFGGLLRDLAQAGYGVQWRCLSASECGATHKRERLFILAYSPSSGLQERQDWDSISKANSPKMELQSERSGSVAHPCNEGLEGFGNGTRSATTQQPMPSCICPDAGTSKRLIESRLGEPANGIPRRLVRWPSSRNQEQKEWEAPRITASQFNRVAKLKALGNAVVPEVAYQIGLWVLQTAGGAS